MENKDAIISKAIEQIEIKKKELDSLKPQDGYQFKTNCRFGELNIKAIQLTHLLNCLNEVFTYKHSMDEIVKEYPFLTNEEFKIYNFNVNEWKDDIIHQIKKIKYTDALKKLEHGSKQLESFYSKDKQDEIAINNLFTELGI